MRIPSEQNAVLYDLKKWSLEVWGIVATLHATVLSTTLCPLLVRGKKKSCSVSLCTLENSLIRSVGDVLRAIGIIPIGPNAPSVVGLSDRPKVNDCIASAELPSKIPQLVVNCYQRL